MPDYARAVPVAHCRPAMPAGLGRRPFTAKEGVAHARPESREATVTDLVWLLIGKRPNLSRVWQSPADATARMFGSRHALSS